MSPSAIWVVVTSRWPTCSLTSKMPPCRVRFNDRQRALSIIKLGTRRALKNGRYEDRGHRLSRPGTGRADGPRRTDHRPQRPGDRQGRRPPRLRPPEHQPRHERTGLRQPLSLLDAGRAGHVVEAVEERLWTPWACARWPRRVGVRSSHYRRGLRERALAHEGTAWLWLLGPFVEDWVRVRGGTPAAKSGRPAHATWARSSGTWTKRFPEERRARHTDCSTPVLVPGPASASPGGLSRMSAILQEEVHSVGGMTLLVKKLQNGQRLTVVVEVITGSDCILHWGLSRRAGGAWRRPPDACWPEGTTAFDGHAVRTPFSTNEKGAKEVEIHLDSPCPWGNLTFALYFPKEGRWVTSEGRDFSIPLPHGHDGASSPEEALAAWAPGESVVRQVFTLDGAERLAVATCAMPETVRVRMV